MTIGPLFRTQMLYSLCVKNFVIFCITYTSCTRKNEAKNLATPCTAYTFMYSNSAQQRVHCTGKSEVLCYVLPCVARVHVYM